jgi:MSHA pilin protein MshC
MIINKLPIHKKSTGFTLVELIVVIVLISVLSVTAFSRFVGTSGFAEYTYQARLVSALRNMQTRAMHDNRDDYCFQINLITTTATTGAAFGPPILDYVTEDPGTADATCSSSIDFSHPDYLKTSATEMSSEDVTLSTEPNFSFINFDDLGRPKVGSADCSATCKITLTGESAVSVCIESEGYIHACE